MPLVVLHTNLKESDLKDGIELRIAQSIAETLGKPLDKMVIVIVPGVRVLRHGTTDPACTVTIDAVNVFDAERNPKYGPSIRSTLKDELGLEGDRFMVYVSLARRSVMLMAPSQRAKVQSASGYKKEKLKRCAIIYKDLDLNFVG